MKNNLFNFVKIILSLLVLTWALITPSRKKLVVLSVNCQSVAIGSLLDKSIEFSRQFSLFRLRQIHTISKLEVPLIKRLAKKRV